MLNKTILTVLMVLAVSVPASIASGGTYSDAVNALGPIDYWRLGETDGNALNDGSGSTEGVYGSSVVRSEAGPRPTDTVGGSALVGFASGNAGAGFISNDDCDDGNSVVNMGNYAPVTGGDARTILAWIKPSVYPTGVAPNYLAMIAHYGNDGWGAGKVVFFNMGPSGELHALYVECKEQTTAVVPLDEWTFVAMTLPDSAECEDTELYFNGVPQDSSLDEGGQSINTGSGMHFTIGRIHGLAWDFKGVIDEVAVFDYQLSADEMAGLFGAAIPEPATAVLLLLGLPFVMRRRRRR